MEQSPQPSPEQDRAQRIAALNDEFRRNGPNGDWVATIGARALSNFPGLVEAVRNFSEFTPDNNPYGERDFGIIPWDSETTYWKIDYYDQQRMGGEDPLSPACRRVLTVMLNSEY